MCSIYASAVRRILPAARLVVDLFHVVQLAVKMTGDVRRRVVREKYGRRSRSGDPEYGVKGLLIRNLEYLAPAQFAKVMDTLGADRHGQEIAAAWIAKEKLRDVLNLRARVTGSVPCEQDVRGRLFTFYDWCAQHDDIPELVTLARTISRWEDEIVCAVLTGVTNARSESLNRLAKLEARMAYSFRNPANQRRRVRIACTRGTRRSRAVTPRRSRLVTGRQPDPRLTSKTRLCGSSNSIGRRSGMLTDRSDEAGLACRCRRAPAAFAQGRGRVLEPRAAVARGRPRLLCVRS